MIIESNMKLTVIKRDGRIVVYGGAAWAAEH